LGAPASNPDSPKASLRLMAGARVLLFGAALALGWPAAAQTPPAEFTTNLIQGATTLKCHFYYHPLRSR
jgi:hypothetical protein